MSKSERLHKILIYLADKNSFNLHDLMNTFNISKSTALRDIAALERIGYPIYSNLGRYGGYGLLHHKMKHQLEFTNDEVYAIYFSLLTLKSYQRTPFHIDALKLQAKFKGSLPEQTKHDLNQMESFLNLESTPHHYDSPLLRELLHHAIHQHVIDVFYPSRKEDLRHYTLQILEINSRFGQWYLAAYNFETKNRIVLRCDKISAVEQNQTITPRSHDYIAEEIQQTVKNIPKITFTVEITKQAVDRFYKENYPSMYLEVHEGAYFIKGSYLPHEATFIANYLLGFNTAIKSIQPQALKELLIRSQQDFILHLETL